VIRCRERQAHRRQHRCHQAFRLPQRQLERRAQHQAGLDGCVLEPGLTTWPKGLPAVQSGLLDPQREAATPAQPCLIGRPVLHLERHLWDVVTAIDVVLVRHRGGQDQRNGRASYHHSDHRSAPTPQHGETEPRGAALVAEQGAVSRAQGPTIISGCLLKQIVVSTIRDNGPSCLRAAAPQKAELRRLRSTALKLSRPTGQKSQGKSCEQDGQEDEGYKLLWMQTHWPGGDWLELWVCPSSAGKDRCSKQADPIK